jgi:hypothetical protein
VFFLLSGPQLLPARGTCVLSPRPQGEGEGQFGQMHGISCDPGCCTLLLYNPSRLFEFSF